MFNFLTPTQASASEDREVFAPIVQRISELATTLIISNRECFVIPRVWADYHSTLESSIDRTKPGIASAFENVSRRNDRLSLPTQRRNGKSADTPKRQLIQILDTIRTSLDIDHLSSVCLSTIADHNILIQALLEWASSPYRVGSSRVYLTVRLLRRWNRGGMDTDESILDFLARSTRNVGVCSHNVYLLIAELVRSRHFSVTRYLRWLIARGTLGGYQTLDPVSPSSIPAPSIPKLTSRPRMRHVINVFSPNWHLVHSLHTSKTCEKCF